MNTMEKPSKAETVEHGVVLALASVGARSPLLIAVAAAFITGSILNGLAVYVTEMLIIGLAFNYKSLLPKNR